MRATQTGHGSIRGLKAYVMLVTILASAFVALPSVNARQRMASGTVVVIAQTKRRVIIAADSRAATTKNGTVVQGINDSYCKIAALSGGVVFTAAGLLSNDNQTWKAVTEADVAIANTPHSRRISSMESDSVLTRWAESMKQRFLEFSRDQLSAYADANDGHVTTGVLAGVEENGQPWIRSVMINYSEDGSLSYQGYSLTSKDPPTAYYVLGKSEVFFEFETDKKTSRALAERAAWGHRGLRGVAFDRFKARRLVELTIKYHLNRLEVGGPVDEIELDDSGARWIQVKPNCQGNTAAKPTPDLK